MNLLQHDDQAWAYTPGERPSLSVGDILRCAYRHSVIPRRATIPAEAWGVDRAAWAAWRERDPRLADIDSEVAQAFYLAEHAAAAARLRRPHGADGRVDDLAVRYRESLDELRTMLTGICRGNMTELSRLTGIPRRTLHRRLRPTTATAEAQSKAPLREWRRLLSAGSAERKAG